jgi:predicted nicotinamide N-methyase
MRDCRPSTASIDGAMARLDPLAIIRNETELLCVPLVPEIRLYQASDPISLWQRMEASAGRTDLDPPFWAAAWAGGQALARYLLDNPELVEGRGVIDIASGSGLVAIAAAKAGAATVTAYDIDPIAAAAITANAAANCVPIHAVCDDILDRADLRSADAHVVLVADAFYERELAGQVMRFLESSGRSGATVLAGDFGRAFLPVDRLRPVATFEVAGLHAVEGTDVKRTTVWTLKD